MGNSHPLPSGFTLLANSLLAFGFATPAGQLTFGFATLRVSSLPTFGFATPAGLLTFDFRLCLSAGQLTSGFRLCHPCRSAHFWLSAPATLRAKSPPALATCAFTTKSANAVYSSIRPKWDVGLLTKKELAENGGMHGEPTTARANRTGRFHVFLLILQAPSSIHQPFPPTPHSREQETADPQADQQIAQSSRNRNGRPFRRPLAPRDFTPAYSVVSKSSRTISSSSDSNSSSPKMSSSASMVRTAPVTTLTASSSTT